MAEAVALLRGAARPLIMAGRVSRDPAAWSRRVALAEALGARVVTDLKLGAAFPTDHRLHVAAPATFALPETARAIAEADVILSLDWVDLAGTLRAACGGAVPAAKVIQVSLDHTLHNGWSMDHQGLPPVDLFLAAAPDVAVAAMLERLGERRGLPGRGDGGRDDGRDARSPGADQRAAAGRVAAPRRRGAACVPAASADQLGRRGLAVPPSARFPWRRRRRRDRRRAGDFGRRRAGADRQRPAAGRDLRRRRFPDGRDRAVDRGALPYPAAADRRQQPLVLQRRAAPGTSRPHARPSGGKPLDRPADFRSGHRPRRAWRARRVPRGSAR